MKIRITSYDEYGKEIITRNYTVDRDTQHVPDIETFVEDSLNYEENGDHKFDTEPKDDIDWERVRMESVEADHEGDDDVEDNDPIQD